MDLKTNSSAHLGICYSVVIPLKNEAGNIASLIDEIEPVMEALRKPWELICIDDGSTDETPAIVTQLCLQKPHLRLIAFDQNYGQSSAFDAGFKAARGEYVITLDGDGQNDPRDIPRLIPLIEESDLVCGIRLQRRDSWTKRFSSRIANAVRNWMCGDGVKDTGCSLKLYRKSCLEQIKLFHGLHRFLPALFTLSGFRVRQLPVNHRARRHGKSHYNFYNRSLNTLYDLLAVCWMKKRRLHYRIDREIGG